MLKKETKGTLAVFGLAILIATAPLLACAGNAPQEPAPVEETETAAEPEAEAGDTEAAAIAGEWYEDVPRESWSQFEKVETSNPWFSVYKLPGNVYAIDEDSQWEEIISYLIIGEDRAILLDTGMGISSIKSVVDELTDLPVTVVLSHTHHDHMGGMHEFDDLLVFDSEYAINRATTGMDEFGDITYEVAAEDGVFNPDRPLPEGFSPEGFHVIGMAPTGTLKDGDVIDLGGRTLQVMYTPGHNADGICLFDAENGIVFTGDMYYPAELYAYNEDAELATYAATMRAVADRAAELNIEWIYPGHNETVHGIGILASAADDFDAILAGTATEYEIGEDGYRYYEFEDGVVIITEDVDFSK
ncbi:MAG: MBL fold metallo-hydrolase [Atopobiaceae bacterium]|nr:MBL fold metallo-hydrolase [Atopobiaceae bacterium]